MNAARLTVLGPALLLGCALTPMSLAEQESASAEVQRTAGYLVSDRPLFEDTEILWPGFIWGLRGFESFRDPVSNPLYNEAPTIETQVKLLYIYHQFPSGSALDGGQLNTFAAQARVALTDRLAFIATKDGYTWFDPGIYPEEEEGWNDLAMGLKYAFIADKDLQLLFTGGLRYQFSSGTDEVFQGNADELSPFLSVGKGWGKLYAEANVTYRFGLDQEETNDVFQWSLHADYEVFRGVAPLVELNGLMYTRDGERLDLTIGGLDYANIGSSDVAGDVVVWLGVGTTLSLTPNVSLGATYEFPLTDADDDIMEDRVTVALTLSF